MNDQTRQTNFILQQGFDAPAAGSCSVTYSGLLFQPRVIAVIVLIGSIAQSAAVFAVLSAMLWWSAAIPRLNPFEAAYNRVFAPRSAFRLSPAPPPRRFAQAVAAMVSLVIASLLAFGQQTVAIVFEVFLLAAIAAILFGGFCFGSYLFHLLKGRAAFANRTLPWSRAA